MAKVEKTVYVTNYDEDGNPTDGTWYYPGDDMPDDVAQDIDNEAVWGKPNDDEHWGTGAPPGTVKPSSIVESGEAVPEDYYDEMTAVQLQNELASRQLPTSGTKAVMIERLKADDAQRAEAAKDTTGN